MVGGPRAQHFLRDFEIENRAGADWSMDLDISRLTAEKFQCFVAYTNDVAVVAIDRDHRRLVEQYSPVWLIDEGVDGPKIDCELVFKKLLDKLHGDGSSSEMAGQKKEAVVTSERQLVCLYCRLGDVFGSRKLRITTRFQMPYDICAVRALIV